MSKLHERIIKHMNISLQEKERCNCELCKGLNVNKTRRKVEVPEQKIENVLQNIEMSSKIENIGNIKV